MVITDAAEEHIPKAKRKKRSPWLSAEAVAIADRRRKLKNVGADRAEIQQANSAFQKQARRDKANFITKTCIEPNVKAEQVERENSSKKLKRSPGNSHPEMVF